MKACPPNTMKHFLKLLWITLIEPLSYLSYNCFSPAQPAHFLLWKLAFWHERSMRFYCFYLKQLFHQNIHQKYLNLYYINVITIQNFCFTLPSVHHLQLPAFTLVYVAILKESQRSIIQQNMIKHKLKIHKKAFKVFLLARKQYIDGSGKGCPIRNDPHCSIYRHVCGISLVGFLGCRAQLPRWTGAVLSSFSWWNNRIQISPWAMWHFKSQK